MIISFRLVSGLARRRWLAGEGSVIGCRLTEWAGLLVVYPVVFAKVLDKLWALLLNASSLVPSQKGRDLPETFHRHSVAAGPAHSIYSQAGVLIGSK